MTHNPARELQRSDEPIAGKKRDLRWIAPMLQVRRRCAQSQDRKRAVDASQSHHPPGLLQQIPVCLLTLRCFNLLSPRPRDRREHASRARGEKIGRGHIRRSSVVRLGGIPGSCPADADLPALAGTSAGRPHPSKDQCRRSPRLSTCDT
jgi:hypothetical protein